MTFKNTTHHYGSIAKFFHWIMALGVIGLLFIGFTMGYMHDTKIKYTIYNTHKLVGLSIFILMLFRLYWRISNIQPALPLSISPILRKIARGVQDTLYLLLFLMPISGWLMSTAANRAPYLGKWHIAFPGISINYAIAKQFNNIHYFFAWTLLGVLSLHIFAAIKHHFWDKDTVLQRILPSFLIKKKSINQNH
ncbi:MAG: Cytochrome b561 [Legionellaceae bacterium]